VTRRSRPCYCGLHDCIETFLCGHGLMQTFAELRKQSHPALSPGQIVTLAAEGDPQALEALDLYYDDLSCALASVVNIFDPEVIVLAGGLSLIPGITTEIAARINHHVFSDGTLTRIVTAMHGDSSGVRGAACLSLNLLQL
jgi:fructokinase